jgi:glycosyltransferase involved in cell wall biosynthesis
VRLELTQEEIASYERAADFLNFNGNDLVCLQHEYGIYGGTAGRHILALLRRLKMPLVTTLHTVLREPDRDQRAVLEEIARLSDRLVVMSELAAEMLREVYAVPSGKIDVIPHGVPEMQFMDPNYYKDKFGTEGKSVLLTFGLLSPNKGIENVIRALPAILERHPKVVYIVSGVTHPHIRRRDGERYREGLRALAEELGVSAQLIFNDRFVSTEELVESVGAADIYITPYRQEAQIVSGTLAIALGAGKAIVSTPYWHARELLAEKRGVIVPCWPCSKTMQSATPCGKGPIFTRVEQRGRRRRGHTWRVFNEPGSNALYSRERRKRMKTRWAARTRWIVFRRSIQAI